MKTGNTGTKTGAIVCVKYIAGTSDLDYSAIKFISNVPADMTDHQLEKLLEGKLDHSAYNCHQVLIRADINSTSNEVTEQFNNLKDVRMMMSYEDLV